MRRLLPVLSLVGILLLAACGDSSAPAADPPAPRALREVVEGTSEGERLPDAGFVTADGETVQLSALRGRPLVINFWATWCGPCRSEIPQLQAAFDQHSSAGLQLIGVTNEDPSVVTPFVIEQQMTYPVMFDRGGHAGDSYRIQATPTTFFLDREGVIVARHVGMVGENLLKVYIEEIMGEAGQPAPGGSAPAITPAVLPGERNQSG